MTLATKVPYLLYEKHGTVGNCRFCQQRTSIMVYPPELKGQIQSPIYVCSRCRTLRWQMDKLGKLFNRTVERIIHSKEIPVIPIPSQLRFQEGVSIHHIEKSQILYHLADWIAEPKIDGIRVMAYIQDEQVRFLTSRHSRNTGCYRDLTDRLSHLQLTIPEVEGTILDGKLVSLDETGTEITQVKFVAFDCLNYKNTDIRHLELEVRQIALSNIFKSISHSHWEQIEVWNPSTPDEMKALFNSAVNAGWDGLMLKNLRSLYKGARNIGWIKWEKIVMIGGND